MSGNVYFNGELLTIPGAYSATDVSVLGTKGDNDGAKILAILGESTGGEPGTVQFFNDPVSARKVLKSGELLKACEKAWNPVSATKEGVKLGGANTIACVRTNAATKSFYEITKTNKPQVKFQSKDWGENTQVQIKLASGSLNLTKRLTVYDQVANVYENFDNLGNVFSMSYTGEAAYAELSISKDEHGVLTLVTKVGTSADAATTDISIVLDSKVYKTMKALIQQLQSYENYTVDASKTYNSRLMVTDLDTVTEQSLKVVEGGTAYRVTAVLADMNQQLFISSQMIELESYDNTLGEIANFDYEYLVGGTEGTSPASWVNYFDMLSNYDVYYIVPLTSDNVVHAELLSHIETSSGNIGKERRAIVGGAIGETTEETLRRARELASDRVQVVHGGLYDYNSYGELTLYAPYILAAQHAGRAAFLEDGESATYDVYRMVNPEYKLERTEVSQLIAGGCLAFEFVLSRNGSSQSFVRLVHDLTTDTTSVDTLHRERATGALADSINMELRSELDSLLTGKRTAVADLTSAKNRVISVLSNRKLKNQIVDFKDVYVTKSGTVTTVDYSVAPAEPNNFTLITAHYYFEDISAE